MGLLSLTAIILTLAAVQAGPAAAMAPPKNLPCKNKSPVSSHSNFVQRHVLSRKFDRKDKQAWARYLDKRRLCGRVPIQSFIDANGGQIDQICSNAGWRVQGATGPKGNLCISDAPMDVYDVTSEEKDRKCSVPDVWPRRAPVVVACNKVDNRCLPVHYEKYTRQEKDQQACA